MTFPFNDTIVPWLPVLDAILKSTILLALAGAVAALLHRASAAARHLVWTLGLASALVLPAVSLALPKWQMPIVTVAAPDSGVGGEISPAAALPVRRGPDARLRSGSGGTPGQSAPSRAAAAADVLRASPMSWQTTLLLLWSAGMLAVLGRLLVGLVAVQWISRRTERVTDAPWLPLARALAAEIGTGPGLTFLRSPRATMPMAWGIAKPSVLMPAEADAWPQERLRIVLLHELAHVKRRDCLTHALAQIACAVYWFNPLAWVAARRLRIERERACDDLVLAAGTRGSDYADQLIEIARVMREGRCPALLTGATLAMAHRSQLEGRLMAILDPRLPRAGVSRLRRTAATALAVCTLLPLASLQPWAYTNAAERVEGQGASSMPTPSAQPVPQLQPAQPQPVEPAPQPVRSPAPVRIAMAAAQAAAEAVAASVVEQDSVEGAVRETIASAVESVRSTHAEAVAGQDSSGRRQTKADPRTVAALTAALNDVDREVRETAMHALIQLRDPSIFEPLVIALKDGSADIREQAAMGLGQLRDQRALEPLRAALKDANAKVREQVVFALGQLRDKGSADALAQALKDESASVREQAAFALGQLRDPGAFEALGAASKDANASVREQAVFALGQLRDRRAVPALTAAASDASDSVREQAVFALGQLRDPAAIDALTNALRDAKSDVRENAAHALGQIRDSRAVMPLIAALKDADPDVRQNAAFALGQIRAASAVEPLVVAIKDEDADVRSQVAFALGQLRDPRAIDALTAALKDASAEVRQQAAFALGQLAR